MICKSSEADDAEIVPCFLVFIFHVIQIAFIRHQVERSLLLSRNNLKYIEAAYAYYLQSNGK